MVHPLNVYIMGTIGLKARVLKSGKMSETVSNCFSVYNRPERPTRTQPRLMSLGYPDSLAMRPELSCKANAIKFT